ncbi:hypothetical protein GCM10028820_05820 [Tessaracoccus terricola]
MPSLRDRALDAAIELLGTKGLKALTHRRIDQQAELPPGSTSNYFRTRGALVAGVLDAILQREMAGAGPAFVPRSADEFVDGVVALLDRTIGEQRVLTSARLALFMEASHDVALRERLTAGRAQFAAVLEPVLAVLGASDPRVGAQTVMACAEGLILHRIARGDDADVRPVVEAAVRGALG